MMDFHQAKLNAEIMFDQLWSFPNPSDEARDIITDLMAYCACQAVWRESIKQAQAEVGKPHGGSLS